MPREGFGVRLARARVAAGLSTRELARRADVRDTDINRWERSPDMDVRSSNVRRVAVALGVSIDYLLGLTDDPAPHDPPASSADALAARDDALRDEEQRRPDRRRGERRAR